MTETPIAVSTGASSAARAWARPLWMHVVLVAGVLVALAFVADRPFTAYTTDEGAYALQARALQTSGKWTHVDPAAPLDPRGIARTRGESGPNGQAFYTVHPLYPLLLACVGTVVGRAGYVALSLVGTLVAATAAALIGRRVDERLGRPCLWVVAVGSPLLFDAYTIEAHSLAAGCAGLALLALIGFVFPAAHRSSAHDALLLVAAASTVALGILVRSEGLVLAAAIVVAFGVLAVLSPTVRRRAAVTAAVILAVSAAARLAEGRVITALLGAGNHAETAPSVSEHLGLLGSRFEAVRATLISPEAGATQRLALFVVLGLGAALATGALVRVRASPRSVMTAGVIAVAAYAAWLLVGPGQEIQGLFVAWPAFAAALVCLSPEAVRPQRLRVAAVVVVVATGGILATEYADGGSLQWGGRYLAILIPLAVPVVAYAVVLLPSPQRRAFVAFGVATTAVLSATAITSLRASHRDSAIVFGSLRGCAALAGPSGAPSVDARPVVVSPDDFVPRFDWPDYDRYQWLSPPRKELASFLRQLGPEGVKRYVLLSGGPLPRDLGGDHVVAGCRGGSLTMAVLGTPA